MTKFADRLLRIARVAIAFAGIPAAASAAGTDIVHTFTGPDGALPFSTLTPDGAGNLYGTTQLGGVNASCAEIGCGTIFKIDRTGNLTTLYSFSNGADGEDPESGVSLIGGMLYGNALGGASGTSVFYSMKTDGSDFQPLYNMTKAQGQWLVGQLRAVPQQGAFGLGNSGGKFGYGTLFKLTADRGLTVVHDFAGGADGRYPLYLIQDSHNNLFGSTRQGGDCGQTGAFQPNADIGGGCGVIFEYVPSTGAYTVLYAFQNTTDGYEPLLGAVAPDGTLYGATKTGGAEHKGALFALTPNGSGYSFSVLSPIKSRSAQDSASNPPTLSPNGSVIGGTASGATYVYQNGQYRVYQSTTAYPMGQFLVPPTRANAILATSETDGTPCPASQYGCGFIYYQQQ
jgi:uncharacterized repeat protein (TIGR03803 family)